MENLIILRCPKIWAHYSQIIMCFNIGTPKIINLPFGTNGKLMVSNVPIFKHFRVVLQTSCMSYWIVPVNLKRINFLTLFCAWSLKEKRKFDISASCSEF